MTANSQSFYIYYDGPAHKNHEMDIRAAAKSLASLGDLIYETNAIVNGDTPIDVKVHAGFVQGSFGAEVLVVQELLQNAKDILPLIGITGIGAFAGGSLLEIVHQLRGRSIDTVVDNDGSFELEVDGEIITCSEDIQKAISAPVVRKAIDSMIHEAMLTEGTDKFCVKLHKDDEAPALEIENEKSSTYRAPRKLYQDKKSSVETEAKIKIITAHADKANNWRVEYLGETVTATIKDAKFLARVTTDKIPNMIGQKFTVKLEKITTDRVGKETISSYLIHEIYHQSVSK